MLTIQKPETDIKAREVFYTLSGEEIKLLADYFKTKLDKIGFKERTIYLKEINFNKVFSERDNERGFINVFYWGDKRGYSINMTFANGLNSNFWEEQKPYIYFEIFPSSTYFKGSWENVYKEQNTLSFPLDATLEDIKKGFDRIFNLFVKQGVKEK